MWGDNRDRGLVHAVHDDLNFIYAAFGVCDCNGTCFEDGGDVVLGLNVSGGCVGGWGWGIGATELLLDIAFKYLRAGRGEPGSCNAGGVCTICMRR